MVPDRSLRFPREFYERDTIEVAIDLLGSLLVASSVLGVTAGRIVEIEAYRDETDLASHAAIYKRGGVHVMRERAGVVYVYRAYGVHAMFNVVAKLPDATGAILLRAVEPVAGVDLMRVRRPGISDSKLASGPGNLCKAYGVTLSDHAADLVEGERFWLQPGSRPARVFAGTRIGITRSAELPWRFFDPDSRSVSAHRRGDLIVR